MAVRTTSFGISLVVSLAGGATGWYLGAVVLDLEPVAALTGAFFTVVVVGAVGTAVAVVWGKPIADG